MAWLGRLFGGARQEKGIGGVLFLDWCSVKSSCAVMPPSGSVIAYSYKMRRNDRHYGDGRE